MSGLVRRRWQAHNEKLLRRELRTEQVQDEEARYAGTNHVGPVDPDAGPPIRVSPLNRPFGALRLRWLRRPGS